MSKTRLWGGFVDGKLCWECEHWSAIHSGGVANADKMPALFFSRRVARKHYRDVRPVTVILPAPKRKARK